MAGPFLRRLGAWVGGFDAGLSNRRLRGFRPARAHVNALLAAAGPDMNARARYLVRNNGYAQGALDSWAANTVGTGVKPSSLIAAPARKAALQRLWQDWTDEADAEGLTDFYGLQRRIAREFFLTGECFVRLRARRPGDGLTVPLQLQCLPSEMLPIGRTEVLGGGRAIRQGIEFDAVGRRVAYHFHRRHPGDPTEPGLAGETVRVPAEDVLHIVDPVESGQLRGVSRFAPAIVKLFLLDQYDDAELDRKKVAAMYAMFITSNDPDAAPLEGELGDQVAPGQIVRLDPGEDMKVADPADSGATYEPFQYRTLLQVSAALGIPYAHLSQDMVKANYSNARTALMEFRRRVEAFQHSVLVYQLCRPVWARFTDLAVLTGAVRLPGYERRRREYLACEWLPPKWQWVDPLKDIRAEIEEIGAGLKSRSQAIGERGYDAEEVDRQIAADRKREGRLGLDFRRSGQGSSAPAAQDGARADEEDDEDDDGRAADRGAGRRAEP
ncbi:phage portal protein [Rhodobacter sphaeroides]|uniref:phage portal protein n=1 Tax=Cereibacter sphaeroides TaxID=1063 RepID=UPI001325645C|nr:phage portal protein [Cereibacter sphaeroides]MWP39392.1 phage portal protein [Cereibacter sphaeroides]